MPSSTSSSDDAPAEERAPDSSEAPPSARGERPRAELQLRTVPSGAWLVPVLVGMVLVTAGAAAVEATWRSLGHLPTVDAEDLDLWAYWRQKASNDRADTVVILGKSRAQLDLDLPTIRAAYPDAVVIQLALRGRGAFAAFEDLCRDARFKGRILWSITEPDLALVEAEGQMPAVERGRHAGPDAGWNAWLRAQVGDRVVLRSQELRLMRVIKNAFAGRTPTPHFIQVEPDRHSHADFSRINIDLIKAQIFDVQRRAMARMGGRRISPQEWMGEAVRVGPLLNMLRDRGGDAVFLHLPVTQESAQFSQRFYPKRLFWDVFSAGVRAHKVHYQEVPALGGFECPDTSHLDEKDAPRFTSALLQELARRGFLAAPSPRPLPPTP